VSNAVANCDGILTHTHVPHQLCCYTRPRQGPHTSSKWRVSDERSSSPVVWSPAGLRPYPPGTRTVPETGRVRTPPTCASLGVRIRFMRGGHPSFLNASS
jgi:hypothetical protein